MPREATHDRRTQPDHYGPAATDLAGISDFGVTVNECLLVPPLDNASVIAGHAGLSRRMNWVHVVDHRDMEDSIVSHELLLTSGIALAHDEALQREIFEIMDRKQSAGLVIAIGDYIPEIPNGMIELADIFEIPLIALPWKVNFGDITRALLTQFVESQYRFMELSQKLNQELLGIVLRRGDLRAVCDCIANVVGVQTVICDENAKPFTMSGTPADSSGFDERSLRRMLSTATFNRATRMSSQVLALDGHVVGVAAPISISNRLRGYIVIEARGMSPGVAGRLAESAATVAALVISHEDELLRVARRADGHLLGLLDGTLPPSVGVMEAIGLRPVDPVHVVIIGFEAGDLPLALALTGEFLRRNAGANALAIRDNAIVGLVQKPRGRTSAWSGALVAFLRDKGLHPLLGVSAPVASPAEIAGKHEDVKDLMRLRHYLQPEEEVVNAEHATVLLRALRNLVANNDLEEICPAIIKIKANDRSLHGSLIEALGCLLEVDWNVSLAARQLGIHRHTILYRLERISEILGTELKASMRFELKLQLLAWRIAGRG